MGTKGGCAVGKKSAARVLLYDDLEYVKKMKNRYEDEMEEADKLVDEAEKRGAALERGGIDLLVQSNMHIARWQGERGINAILAQKGATQRITAALEDHAHKLVAASDANTRAATEIGKYTFWLMLATVALGSAASSQVIPAIAQVYK
jgi:hypothetical protein